MSERVTVIVCAYTEERWDDLVAAVDSVLAQRPAPHQIVVVVDHNDALCDRARRHLERDSVQVVANARPRGLSGARNTGLAAANGDLVAFLDDDAVALDGWLARLVAPFADPAVVATGGHVQASTGRGRPAWWPHEFDWVIGCSWTGLPDDAAPVRNVIGCNMAFRRDAVRAVGGFADGIGRVGSVPVGCEETDLCIRLRAADPSAQVLYLPAAEVVHRVAAERLRWGYFRRRCVAEGRSKALVAGRNGQTAALAEERRYVRVVLPRAVARALTGAVRGERGALRRAGAVVAGLALTGTGYVTGRLARATP